MALDSDNNWSCIETDLFGEIIRFTQYADESFFGEHTDQIINNFVIKDK